jgi:hypothetical protein
MREAFGLVNALTGFPGPRSEFSSGILFSGGYSGRTVALTLKFEAANG